MSMGVGELAELMEEGLQVDAYSPLFFLSANTLTVFCVFGASRQDLHQCCPAE